jgi:hypothetical protein
MIAYGRCRDHLGCVLDASQHSSQPNVGHLEFDHVSN